jgi:hypothetical protein
MVDIMGVLLDFPYKGTAYELAEVEEEIASLELKQVALEREMVVLVRHRILILDKMEENKA